MMKITAEILSVIVNRNGSSLKFSGRTLCFDNPLLDTVIDRFGTKGVRYAKTDDEHFRVDIEVEISDQFFGWLLGFGSRVRIMGPDSAIDAFRDYLNKVCCMY